MTVTVRFAPSPTGKLHVGNIRAALFNWLFAKKMGGDFILRIDDTDQERSTKAFEEGIYADLEWLGLRWSDTKRQSSRFAEYDAAVDALKAKGLLYACYETPEELDRKRKLQRARGLPPVYDRSAMNLTPEQVAAYEAEGRKPHWRFKLSGDAIQWNDLVRGETKVDTSSVSDPVLVRADGGYLYTLPSVVDDIAFGITHIVRGEDHVTNTGVQVEIFRELGGEVPQFAHHSLLVGAGGEALSKRLGSLAIENLREDGLEPQALTSLLAKLGTSDSVEARRTLEELAAEFDFGRLGRAPARFDPDELQLLNAKLLHILPYADVSDRLASFEGVEGEAFWNAIRGNIERFEDAELWRQVVAGPIEPEISDPEFCATAAGLFPTDAVSVETWKEWTALVGAETSAKGKKLFLPLRLALTGQGRGPAMDDLLPLIGSEKARARLNGENV